METPPDGSSSGLFEGFLFDPEYNNEENREKVSK